MNYDESIRPRGIQLSTAMKSSILVLQYGFALVASAGLVPTATAQYIQEGSKLVGTGGVVGVGGSLQGSSVTLSADGNTAVVGALDDNDFTGAVWVYTRSGGVWSQQGAKLVGAVRWQPALDPVLRQLRFRV